MIKPHFCMILLSWSMVTYGTKMPYVTMPLQDNSIFKLKMICDTFGIHTNTTQFFLRIDSAMAQKNDQCFPDENLLKQVIFITGERTQTSQKIYVSPTFAHLLDSHMKNTSKNFSSDADALLVFYVLFTFEELQIDENTVQRTKLAQIRTLKRLHIDTLIALKKILDSLNPFELDRNFTDLTKLINETIQIQPS